MQQLNSKLYHQQVNSVSLLDLRRHHEPLKAELMKAISKVVDSQRFILGPEVDLLEKELAAYCGVQHALGVSSGTDALLMALMAVGIEPGDEVLTTPFTFFATVGSIARLGAVPVFVDIDPVTFNIDVKSIKQRLTPRTRAIVPVHLFGQLADMGEINRLAEEHGLFVIEDACQSIGAELEGRKAGAWGHVGCFSFFPSKNLGAFGDGGFVTTNDERIADKLKLIRNHGSPSKYHHSLVGGNFRLDAMQAAVLRVKLPYLDSWSEARSKNAELYRQGIKERKLPLVSPVEGFVHDGRSGRHVYNQFTIRCSQRDALRDFLACEGVSSEVYYPVPHHLQQCFSYLGYSVGDAPESERAAQEVASLPIFPELYEEEIMYVLDVMSNFFDSHSH